jgi:hypothetical protein
MQYQKCANFSVCVLLLSAHINSLAQYTPRSGTHNALSVVSQRLEDLEKRQVSQLKFTIEFKKRSQYINFVLSST